MSDRYDASASAPRPDRIKELRNVGVEARDGVRLSVDLYLPRGDRPLAAILALTPYDNGELRADARWFVEHGYAYVAADQRGRYDSAGVYDPFDGRHKDDGYDLVEWIAAQPWCTGKVGMTGGSALGWTQWWTASAAPPHLAAILPLVAPGDPFENVPYQHGVLVGGWFPDWAAMMTGGSAHVIGPGGYAGWGANREVQHRHTPYSDINAARGIAGGGSYREWLLRHRSDDPYWEAISYEGEERFGRIGVPSLGVGGWFDVVLPGTPLNYSGMRRFGSTPEARRPLMIIGPWTHGINQRVVGGVDFGPDAVIDLDGLTLRWFDHHLRGADNGIDREPPVRVFVMGENAWRELPDWPPPDSVPTPLYLAPEGALSWTHPETAGADGYVHDPRDPVPSVADSGGGNLDGPVDTSAVALRDDVLVYRTPVLETAVEVVGPLEAVLFASTSARDTDWLVRLVDIQPDGRSLLLAEGALRARNSAPDDDGRFDGTRLTEIEPDAVRKYTVRFWRDTANVFLPGHRIGVEISSSWFPFFLPNLGTGADNLATVTVEEAVVARQGVYHGGDHASHILLPLTALPIE
jgi:putative CocE/NonD family hydrolase